MCKTDEYYFWYGFGCLHACLRNNSSCDTDPHPVSLRHLSDLIGSSCSLSVQLVRIGHNIAGRGGTPLPRWIRHYVSAVFSSAIVRRRLGNASDAEMTKIVHINISHLPAEFPAFLFPTLPLQISYFTPPLLDNAFFSNRNRLQWLRCTTHRGRHQVASILGK